MTGFYFETPALKIARSASTLYLPTAVVKYLISTANLASTIIMTQDDSRIWAGPGWLEVFTSQPTVYISSDIFEGSSQVLENG